MDGWAKAAHAVIMIIANPYRVNPLLDFQAHATTPAQPIFFLGYLLGPWMSGFCFHYKYTALILSLRFPFKPT